jgi:hypothetical protein
MKLVSIVQRHKLHKGLSGWIQHYKKFRIPTTAFSKLIEYDYKNMCQLVYIRYVKQF